MGGPPTLSPHSPQVLQNAQTAAQDGGILYIAGQCARLTVVLQGAGTITTGNVSIEEAYYDQTRGDPVYAGTWSLVTTAIALGTVTGGQQSVVHFTGSLWAVRVRISTALTGGGTITAIVWAN